MTKIRTERRPMLNGREAFFSALSHAHRIQPIQQDGRKRQIRAEEITHDHNSVCGGPSPHTWGKQYAPHQKEYKDIHQRRGDGLSNTNPIHSRRRCTRCVTHCSVRKTPTTLFTLVVLTDRRSPALRIQTAQSDDRRVLVTPLPPLATLECWLLSREKQPKLDS